MKKPLKNYRLETAKGQSLLLTPQSYNSLLRSLERLADAAESSQKGNHAQK